MKERFYRIRVRDYELVKSADVDVKVSSCARGGFLFKQMIKYEGI